MSEAMKNPAESRQAPLSSSEPSGEAGRADWDARYAAADTPWDMGQVSPPLVCFRNEGILPAGRRTLIPGCGSGYEVAFLAEAGYEAVGADFSPRAVEAARRMLPAGSAARIVEADLLSGDPAELGVFDWVFDQTFFCAIAPGRRAEYAAAMGRLVRPGGELWALSFRVSTPGGPPFDSTPEAFIELMSATGFELVQRRPLDGESHPARRGRETLVRMRRC